MTDEERQPSVSVSLDTNIAPKSSHAWLRVLLFALHITALAAALSLTPGDYAYQLGYQAGTIIVITCLFLWSLLYFATTARGQMLFSVLALAQVGLIAFIAHGFQAEDRILREVAADLQQRQQVWAKRLAHFSMDPLYEMCAGERQLSTGELKELHARAKAAQAEIPELQAEMKQWEQQAENRVAKVSPQGARDFRLGLESRQSESDEIMKLTQAVYTEDESLTEFLIRRQRNYRLSAGTFVFDTDQDAHWFNDKTKRITQLREQLGTLLRKEQETLRQTSAASCMWRRLPKRWHCAS